MNFQIDPRMVISHPTQKAVDQKNRDLESLKESSKQFEAMFVMEMLKAMRKAIPEGGLFEKNVATETWQEMLDYETAQATTRGKGLGLAEAMYNQMAPFIENKK